MYKRQIIVPIFNHELYLEECLNALTRLNYPNIEILLCDDGSTDDSYLVAKKWLQRNAGINARLFTQENQGVCKTLNRLICESSGEYLTLCASDDVLLPDGLGDRVDLLEHDNLKLACVGDAELINEHSHKIADSAMKTLYNADYDLLRKDIVRELVVRWSIVGPTLLIRRSAYDVVGFYDESLLVEDREFYLRLLSRDAVTFWPHVVASYRIHQNNVSRKSTPARLSIINQVALSNTKLSNHFTGSCRLFLASHHADLFILSLGESKRIYYLLQSFRMARKIIFSIVLSLERII